MAGASRRRRGTASGVGRRRSVAAGGEGEGTDPAVALSTVRSQSQLVGPGLRGL
jgi:hypothetical protein